MIGSFIASLFVQGLGEAIGMDYMETVNNLAANAPIGEKNFIKAALCLSHLCTFILPAFIFLGLTYKKDRWQEMKLKFAPSVQQAFLGGLLILIAFPLVQFIFFLNRQLPLPEWALTQEDLINTTIKNLLHVNSSSELLLNLFTIALLPAIGEELMFRGILQQTFQKAFKNPHIAIWLTALVFSFIHFQFQGFLPRVLLGGLLGYLFVWTQNLWVPIIAHLVYNAGQVLLQYFHQQGVLGIDLNEVEMVPIWLVGMSILGSSLLVILLRRKQSTV